MSLYCKFVSNGMDDSGESMLFTFAHIGFWKKPGQ